MISVICLWWIGIKLAAPGWYYALLIIAVLIHFFKFGLDMYKAGADIE